MSVDIDWDTISSGPDGLALSETIRDFIHTKFQQITLPRFIKSVHVHSFEFGSTCPEIEIKDITDPLPDFYEDDDSSEGSNADAESRTDEGLSPTVLHDPSIETMSQASGRRTHPISAIQEGAVSNNMRQSLQQPPFRPFARSDRPGSIDTQGFAFPRSGTPGIPGGTSNLSYFHLPVGGLSGAQTPLAAVASGTPFSQGPWQHDSYRHGVDHLEQNLYDRQRPRTSDSIPSPEIGSPYDPSSPETRPVGFHGPEKVSDDLALDEFSISPSLGDVPSNPSDLQVIARVKYDGDVRMTLTAEILLDYPMPSFVGIPLKLAVTGMKFDGVAILAYIKKRMHFCFLDAEDAQTLVGDQDSSQDQKEQLRAANTKSTLGSLLREVQIESEIGRQESGKQVLKNVGKVEKFVLEQVKKIFEEEFVFPSFWTFLV